MTTSLLELAIRISLMTFWESCFSRMVRDGVGELTVAEIEKACVDILSQMIKL